MDTDLRFGAEIEVQDLMFTFAELSGTHGEKLDFWKQVNGVKEDIFDSDGNHAILTALLPEHFSDEGLKSAGMGNWKLPFGFIVTPDNYTLSGQEERPRETSFQVPTFHFEINSSAQYTTNIDHWACFRRAVKAFVAALNTFDGAKAEWTSTPASFPHSSNKSFSWFSLSSLVTAYNKEIDKLLDELFKSPSADREYTAKLWKLQLSPRLAELQAKSAQGWTGVFCFHSTDGSSKKRRCDVQVNYEINLDALAGPRHPQWLEMWAHQWVSFTPALRSGVRIDEDCGYGSMASEVPTEPLYSNTLLQSLWNAARYHAAEFLNANGLLGTSSPANPKAAELFHNNCSGFITLIFACSAILNNENAGLGAKKNSYGQLPKSSLYSIVHQMCELHKDIPDLKQKFEQYSRGAIASSALHIVKSLRSPETLRKFLIPSNAKAPTKELDGHPYWKPLVNSLPMMDIPALPPAFTAEKDKLFVDMWKNIFKYPTVPAPADLKTTHTTDAASMFFCPWALANTPKPAEIYECSSTKERRIKVLFESRRGNNRLNLGFNPDVFQDEYFYIAFSGLARLRAAGEENLPQQMRSHVLHPAGTKDGFEALMKRLDAVQEGGVYFH